MNKLNTRSAATARRRTVALVRAGRVSRAAAARRLGVHRSTVGRWVSAARRCPVPYTGHIAVRRHHVSQLDVDTTRRILELRRQTGRCAPVIGELLAREGTPASTTAIARTLSRTALTSPRYRWPRQAPQARPQKPMRPGELVQVDAIELRGRPGQERFVFTVIDVATRWAYAEAHQFRRQTDAIVSVLAAQAAAPFAFQTVQADNGPEFGLLFDHAIDRGQVRVRHTKRGTPSENAFIERFNRTLLDECIRRRTDPDLEPALTRGQITADIVYGARKMEAR